MIGRTWFYSHPCHRTQVAEQLAAFARMKEVSKFFGGTPRPKALR